MDHHGHRHGGHGPLWYQRLLFILSIGLIVLFAITLMGVKCGWLH